VSLRKIYSLLTQLRAEILKPITDGHKGVQGLSDQVTQLRAEVQEIKALLAEPSAKAAKPATVTKPKGGS